MQRKKPRANRYLDVEAEVDDEEEDEDDEAEFDAIGERMVAFFFLGNSF